MIIIVLYCGLTFFSQTTSTLNENVFDLLSVRIEIRVTWKTTFTIIYTVNLYLLEI